MLLWKGPSLKAQTTPTGFILQLFHLVTARKKIPSPCSSYV